MTTGMRTGIGASTALVALALGMSVAAATVAARPAIRVDPLVAQGTRVALPVNPHGGHYCRLATVDPAGRQRTVRVAGGKPYRLAFLVRKSAKPGDWQLAVRCARGGVSKAASMRVTGVRRGSGSSLFRMVRREAYRRLAGIPAPARDQDASGGPSIDTAEIDGIGAGEGGRGLGAIQWALSMLGNPTYNGWCLRFVANAYGATHSGYATAAIAARALAHNAGDGPAAAPAGALVFFFYRAKDGSTPGHVGISLGDGRMVNAVATVRVDSMLTSDRRRNYLGWAYPPASWPGRPATAAPASPATQPAPSSQPSTGSPSPAGETPQPGPGGSTGPSPGTTTPPAPPRKVITVDNRVTNGMGMREDATPASLTTKPWKSCSSRGCNIANTQRTSGGSYDAAVCQTQGDRVTNGNDSSAADDANPERFESARFYGVRLTDGTFGYISEVWIRSADRGGLGLPAC